MADINHHISIYKKVFLYLLILTIVTVGVSYIDIGLVGCIFVGLLIASIKGFLVAANFMHLNSERGLIYIILALTVLCFMILLFIPLLWDMNLVKVGY